MQDRRQHYRVQAEFAKEVGLRITFGSSRLEVEAKDLSAGGAGLLLPLTSEKEIEVGVPATLLFEAPWCEPVKLTGKIIRIIANREEEVLDVGVVFTDWEEKRDNLSRRLRRIFNERRVYRVRTPPGHTVTGMVALGNGEIQRLPITDIGVFGVMIAVDNSTPVSVDQMGSCTLQVDDEPLAMPCQVCHIQTPKGEDTQYIGLHFYRLASMSRVFEQMLIDYVFNLQRDELKGPQKTSPG